MADKTLFVVTGAGASFDASHAYRGRVNQKAERPPLTKDLFDKRFEKILRKYPMAQNAAPDIQDALSGATGEPATSLEHYLRTNLRDSKDPLNQRRFLSITLYLQEVLWRVSAPVDVDFDHMYRLINRVVGSFDHVCFITLNYDVILDRCLSAFGPLRDLGNFISDDRWSLIKLHGSITWGRPIEDSKSIDLENPPSNLTSRLGDGIYHRWELNNFEHLRGAGTPTGSVNAFPALSIPLGEEDEIVCPDEHVSYLEERLAACDELDLLVIGYSGLDRAVLGKIQESDRRIRSMFVVNADEASAGAIAHDLHGKLNTAEHASGYATKSFGNWVLGGGAQKWVREHPALHS